MAFCIMPMRYLALVLLLLAGCRNNAGNDAAPPPTKQAVANDQTSTALEIFRHGGDSAQLREGLILLDTPLARPENAARLVLSSDERGLLQESARVTPAELAELEAVHFRPLDAVVLESAVLFRDAARSLEVPGMSPAQQAAFAFDWVARHVLLYEQRQDNLPPAFVLRAGHGGATDRGLVFLALMHQWRREGCLLVAPDMKTAPLVGLLIDGQLHLFDTRLGLPVPGPGGKGIATWSEVVKQPDLLANSKITAEQIAAMEAKLAQPLEMAAPRMRYLDSLVQGDEAHIGSERLATHHDLVGAKAALQAAGIAKVGFWLPALRAAGQFAAVDDGGTDRTHRAKRFASTLIPWSPVLQRYQDLRIYADLPNEARQTLENITAELFDRYYRQPGEMLVRGKTEALPRRLERIRAVSDDADFGSPKDEQELAQLAAAWRERVNAAYLAALRDPSAAGKVREIWDEDHYLLYLIQQPDLDEIPRSAVKKTLSRLVLAAARQPLSARANWLFASLSLDKAERAQVAWQMQKAAGKDGKSAAANVRNAWLNARSAWNQYLDRNNLGPSVYVSALPNLRRLLERGEFERAMNQWEYLQTELHHYAAARLAQARAMRHTGQDASANLDLLSRELEQLRNNPVLARERESAPASGLLNAIDGPRRWMLLMRDWGPEGNLAWIGETVRLENKKGTPP
jgi:phage antirepressor YoqD-like protein